MEADLIQQLTSSFAPRTDTGIEFWLARDLQRLLGYSEWRNFQGVISKAKTACEISGFPITDHFVDVNKVVQLGAGERRR